MSRVAGHGSSGRGDAAAGASHLEPYELLGGCAIAPLDARVRSGAAALGAHNDEILEELGLSEAERRALRERGVI